MTITHADIIPLIGGMTLGSERAFGTRPDYLVSFEAFGDNDRHIVDYYEGEVPYYVLDKGDRHPKYVDVVSSTCPCAGLSQMHHAYGDDNPNNVWMPRTARYVLEEMKPQVYWGENAPGFAGKIGKTVREELYKIGRDAGYSMTVYRTKSLLHGVPQVRERSFYFFWKGDRTPVLDFFNRPYTPIEQVILDANGNTQREPINPKTPSDDPWYRYILEEVHGGRTHREHCELVEPSTARGNDALTYIERQGHDYPRVAVWMKKNGYDRQAASCERMHAKLQTGGNLYRRGVVVPKDYIGAFVAHYPTMLTHPVEDRFINYREAMTIMGMPQDFQLVGANPKNANHICQNVPVTTAADMASEVRAALEGKRPWVDSTLTFQYNHSRKVEEAFPTRTESTLMEMFQ